MSFVAPTPLKKGVSVSMSVSDTDDDTDTCDYVQFIHFFKLLPVSICRCCVQCSCLSPSIIVNEFLFCALIYFSFIFFLVNFSYVVFFGLGSGLHTFVLYLGPHIAFFTIKAMQCGRVDLKSAPYDTIQLDRGPSWLDKDCSEFGPSLFQSEYGSQIPLSIILIQVQLEAVLWGMGTAIGELPPYFISRAGIMKHIAWHVFAFDKLNSLIDVLSP